MPRTTADPQTRKTMYSSASADWPTPQDFFDRVNAMFGFVVDACASTTNAKAACLFAKDHPDPARRDGLAGKWARDANALHGAVWCNPPYGKEIGKWTRKAAAAARKGAPTCSPPGCGPAPCTRCARARHESPADGQALGDDSTHLSTMTRLIRARAEDSKPQPSIPMPPCAPQVAQPV